MQRLKQDVALRQIYGAIHQDEGIIIQTQDQQEYSFVPSGVFKSLEGKDICFYGSITKLQNGRFTDTQSRAELYLRSPNTEATYTELKVLGD